MPRNATQSLELQNTPEAKSGELKGRASVRQGRGQGLGGVATGPGVWRAQRRRAGAALAVAAGHSLAAGTGPQGRALSRGSGHWGAGLWGKGWNQRPGP